MTKKTDEAVRELSPVHDGRKSFYGKAHVDDRGDTKILYSYNTPVAMIKDGEVTLGKARDRGYPFLVWRVSQTTLRHVREFLRQNGFKADSLRQMEKDYKADFINESCEENKSVKEECDGWIAFFNDKKVEVTKDEAKNLLDAKQVAIKKLNVPKSKSNLLSIEPAYKEDNLEKAPASNAQFEGMREELKEGKEKKIEYVVISKDNEEMKWFDNEDEAISFAESHNEAGEVIEVHSVVGSDGEREYLENEEKTIWIEESLKEEKGMREIKTFDELKAFADNVKGNKWRAPKDKRYFDRYTKDGMKFFVDDEKQLIKVVNKDGKVEIFDKENKSVKEEALKESSKLDIVDAKADNKKEKAKATYKKELDDADADRDYHKRKLKEEYYDVFDDLVDRVKLYLEDGYSLDDAILHAIDDGLIYTTDIVELAQHYGVIDEEQLLNDMYDDLYGDLYEECSDYEVEEDEIEDFSDEEVEEALKKHLR